jgi:hypothetical protein
LALFYDFLGRFGDGGLHRLYSNFHHQVLVALYCIEIMQRAVALRQLGVVDLAGLKTSGPKKDDEQPGNVKLDPEIDPKSDPSQQLLPKQNTPVLDHQLNLHSIGNLAIFPDEHRKIVSSPMGTIRFRLLCIRPLHLDFDFLRLGCK